MNAQSMAKKLIANMLAILIAFNALGVPALIAAEASKTNTLTSDCMHEIAAQSPKSSIKSGVKSSIKASTKAPAKKFGLTDQNQSMDCLERCRQLTGKAIFNAQSLASKEPISDRNACNKFSIIVSTITFHKSVRGPNAPPLINKLEPNILLLSMRLRI